MARALSTPKISTALTLAVFLAVALGAGPTARAGDSADTIATAPPTPSDSAYVDYRQDVMKGIGADMAAISDILKNGLPFTAAIALHADRLDDAAALIPTAFEKNVTAGATDAKPAIWEQPDKFKEAIAEFEDAAEDLEEAADDGDLKAIAKAAKHLGKSCGSCHKTFRKPKEESYKNQ